VDKTITGFWKNLDQAQRHIARGQGPKAQEILQGLCAKVETISRENARKYTAVLARFADIYPLSMPPPAALISKPPPVNQPSPTIIRPRERLFVDVQHGLCNRLRAMASAAIMARQSGRELVVIWQPDHHCDCRLDDLFHYDGALLEQSFIKDTPAHNLTVYNYMEAEAGAEKDALIDLAKSGDIYARTAYPLNNPQPNRKAEDGFLKALTVSDPVLELTKNVPKDNALGVHVRMEGGRGMDQKSYDRPENWTPEGHDQLHYWRATSHYTRFMKRIDALIKEGGAQTVFLAADTPKTYAVFADRYGDRLTFLKRTVFDRSTAQIQYALADVLLLSECRALLGSSWSSFTEMALRLAGNLENVEMSGTDF